jgi:hypothetical protein
MVIDIPPLSCRYGVCAGCVLRKNHRESFDKRASWHASSLLQLVHSDLCGPLFTPFSRCNYFLTFIDDFSKRTWVYFLKLSLMTFISEPTPVPPLPRWVHSTREAIVGLVGDPSYQC